jgi:hypothetical protein
MPIHQANAAYWALFELTRGLTLVCNASQKSATHPKPEVNQRFNGRFGSRPRLAVAKVSRLDFGQNRGNSVDISKGFFEMGAWKFESSEVSQAVRRPERVFLILAERPANRGLL